MGIADVSMLAHCALQVVLQPLARAAGWPLYCSAAAAVMMGRDTSNCTHFCRIVDSGQWTRCLSYLYAESRVFLQPVSPDSAAARHVVQTLSIQYNYVCEGEVRDHFCGQGSWRGKEAWLCQLIDWVRLLGHSNGNSSHFRLCEQICFVLSMVYIWTAQLSLQCSRRLQESSTPFVYRRRAAARPSHHDSLAWKAFWLKVESLKSFSHATGVDCFETITIACPVLS